MRKTSTKKRKSFFMSKAKFNSLSASAKRVHIAKDVIKQLELKKLLASEGDFVNLQVVRDSGQPKLKQFMELPDTDACEVCAKGAMFMSFCGIKNGFELGAGKSIGVQMSNDSMIALSKVFEPDQLSLIEIAFEKCEFPWSVGVEQKERDAAVAFGKKYKTARGRLVAICNNIIKNKGTFKP